MIPNSVRFQISKGVVNREKVDKDFLDPNISNKEFAKRLSAMANEVLQSVSMDELDLNREQLQKFDDLVNFFESSAVALGGRIDSINITPAFGVGDLTASFIVFDLAGEDIQRFCDVIRNCSAISMDVTADDKICISCTVPNIFTLKS